MRSLILLLSLTLGLALPLPLAAGYSDPKLKVLLFSTTGQIHLSSSAELHLDGEGLMPYQDKQVQVASAGRGQLTLDGQLVQGKLWVQSAKPIRVKRGGEKYGKAYEGIIEVMSLKGGLQVINHVHTEAYLRGVLNGEIDTRWNMEVLKAQAVIARTYALLKRHTRKSAPYHLTSSAQDQVYYGVSHSDIRGQRALEQTRGLVISFQGQLAEIFYHSNCGGITEDPGNLWAYSLPYLAVKSVPFGNEDPRYYWEASLSDEQVQKILRKAGRPIAWVGDLYVSERNSSNRVQEITIEGARSIKLSGQDFRRLAGYSYLPSLLFNVVRVPGGFYFKGRGNGHGVGLCQWAAKEMADLGYDYQEILAYFYQGVDLSHYPY